MKLLPFKESKLVSLGVELEFQIIDPSTFGLVSRAKELIRITEEPFQEIIKPEITQSMIEINSSPCTSIQELQKEFVDIQKYLLEKGNQLGVYFCGGGTHPFQKWALEKIFPTKRFKSKSRLYQYLSKRSTVFGQHVHVGCESGEDALYLTHALARYVPHFVALSASSPFYQGIDTGYHSSRSNIFNVYPLSGVIPYLTTWEEFSNYYYKIRDLGMIENMKDVYWDIRPKPEFGTVELRVCDTPLSMKKALNIAAFVQAIAYHLLTERTFKLSRDLYYIYNYNRFQASRYGFEGDFIDPVSLQHRSIAEDILQTVQQIEKSANHLKVMPNILKLVEGVTQNENDASLLRKYFHKFEKLTKVVREQCQIWSGDLN